MGHPHIVCHSCLRLAFFPDTHQLLQEMMTNFMLHLCPTCPSATLRQHLPDLLPRLCAAA
jgi:hypothetical protein